jgi:hypothetical protein
VSESQPCRVSAEAEARYGPVADGALVVREYVRWEDVDEERNVLHCAHYKTKQGRANVDQARASANPPICASPTNAPSMPYKSTLYKCERGSPGSANHIQQRIYGKRGYSRMAIVVIFLFTAPSQVPAFVHRSLAVVPLILLVHHRDQRDPSILIIPLGSLSRVQVGQGRTNVTTMKSRGFCRFEEPEACLSATHANAARAVVSTVSVECRIP